MTEQELLLAYGEWLDAQSLLVDEEASGDKRSLGALSIDFLVERAQDRPPLCPNCTRQLYHQHDPECPRGQ